MAKDSATKKSGSAKKVASPRARKAGAVTTRQKAAAAPDDAAETVGVLNDRIAGLEDAIERLLHKDFYHGLATAERGSVAPFVPQDRFVRPTTDGWIEVLIGGARQPLFSGTKVAFSQTSGGRDYGVVSEGAFEGKSFDVASGNLDTGYRRLQNLIVKAVTRPGGPIDIDGVPYELNITLSYREGGAAKSSGPFPARTDPDNPLPAGTHDLEIPDFPHPKGKPYGPHGMVWFRIGHSGDRYLHPGKGSLGCITCAPANWPVIYNIVHASRLDSKSTGRLTYAP